MRADSTHEQRDSDENKKMSCTVPAQDISLSFIAVKSACYASNLLVGERSAAQSALGEGHLTSPIVRGSLSRRLAVRDLSLSEGVKIIHLQPRHIAHR